MYCWDPLTSVKVKRAVVCSEASSALLVTEGTNGSQNFIKSRNLAVYTACEI